MSSRIQPKSVKEAFEYTGLKPIQKSVREYGGHPKRLVGGCGLCALWATNPNLDHHEYCLEWARKRYGRNYISGFIMGWDKGVDNNPGQAERSEDFQLGVADGIQSWKSVTS